MINTILRAEITGIRKERWPNRSVVHLAFYPINNDKMAMHTGVFIENKYLRDYSHNRLSSSNLLKKAINLWFEQQEDFVLDGSIFW